MIQSVASGLSRIDFLGGTGQILLEPASTNLALNSNDLTNSSWTKFNATTSTSTVVNPEGTSGASLYTCDNFIGTNQFFRINPNTVYTSDANFTYSMFVKYNTFQFCKLSYIKYSPQVYFAAVFDILNGTVTATDSNGTPQNTSSKIENFGNGWFRISISAAISSSSGNQMNFEFNKSPSGTPTFTTFGRTEQETTTNDKVYVYGVQLEQQSFATSYIPTSGSTVTRNKDEANNSGNASLINTTEGVLYTETACLVDGTNNRAISIGIDGQNHASIQYNPSSNRILGRYRNAGNFECQIQFDVADRTQFSKIAFRYKQDDFALFVNGAKVATDISGNVLSANTFTNLALNSVISGIGQNFEGKIKCIAVYKEFLTDAELIALTS